MAELAIDRLTLRFGGLTVLDGDVVRGASRASCSR